MKYKIENHGFVKGDSGSAVRTIKLPLGTVSKSWDDKQERSFEDDYKVSHLQNKYSESTTLLQKFFKSYIIDAVLEHHALSDQVRMLDIGCGISVHIPPYIGSRWSNKVQYIGLDPFDVNPERDYLFIQGRAEDLPGTFEEGTTFDTFIFSTSLDHVFWIGLRDTEYLINWFALDIFRKMYRSLEAEKYQSEVERTLNVRFPAVYDHLLKYERKFQSGIPFDDYHFHYFTKENIKDYVGQFGEIVDMTAVFDTPNLFITCKGHD